MIEQFGFNKIFIVQSIPETERQTGYEIESVIKILAINNDVSVELIDVNSAEGFLSALEKIAQAPTTTFPYIHIESHGDKIGLYAANGDLIQWERLKIALLLINKRCKNNLFISVAACYGAHLIKIIRPWEPCPLNSYIGPEKEESPFDLEVSYTEFFRTLINEHSLTLALKKLPRGFAFINYRGYFEMLINNHKENPSIRDEVHTRTRAALKLIDSTRNVSDEEIDQFEKTLFEEMRTVYFSIANHH